MSANGGAGRASGGRAIGVDPGTERVGWGVVEMRGGSVVHVAYGVIRPAAGSLAARLAEIDRALGEVVLRERPVTAAVEGVFQAGFARSALMLGHGRGVALAVLGRAGLDVAEYAPAAVKATVAGSGRAEKEQVARAIAAVLGLGEVPAADAADALAVALCHVVRSGGLRRGGRDQRKDAETLREGALSLRLGALALNPDPEAGSGK